MTDRELLELAAKAAGVEGRYSAQYAGTRAYGGIWHNGTRWNPLDDDGDALRLAVKLGICVAPGSNSESHQSRFAVATGDSGEVLEERREDPYVATRRAIVRAAAEIGRNMK